MTSSGFLPDMALPKTPGADRRVSLANTMTAWRLNVEEKRGQEDTVPPMDGGYGWVCVGGGSTLALDYLFGSM